MSSRVSRRRILVTGVPAVGKTIVIQKVVERLRATGVRLAGFTTHEMRRSGGRVGFRVVSLDGREAIMARTGPADEGPRVGRYAVDVEAFEGVALQAIDVAKAPPSEIDLYVIDEIGRMECLSPRFVAAVDALVATEAPLLATVGPADQGLIGRVRSAPDAELVEVTRENRDALPDEIAARLLAPT